MASFKDELPPMMKLSMSKKNLKHGKNTSLLESHSSKDIAPHSTTNTGAGGVLKTFKRTMTNQDEAAIIRNGVR